MLTDRGIGKLTGLLIQRLIALLVRSQLGEHNILKFKLDFIQLKAYNYIIDWVAKVTLIKH